MGGGRGEGLRESGGAGVVEGGGRGGGGGGVRCAVCAQTKLSLEMILASLWQCSEKTRTRSLLGYSHYVLTN